MSQKTVKISEVGTDVKMDPEREKLSNHNTIAKPDRGIIESKPMRVGVEPEGRVGTRIVSQRNASEIIAENSNTLHRQDLCEIIELLTGSKFESGDLQAVRTVAKATVMSIVEQIKDVHQLTEEMTALRNNSSTELETARATIESQKTTIETQKAEIEKLKSQNADGKPRK